jgi:spore coat polysaccharide biosynthesis protein SpsF
MNACRTGVILQARCGSQRLPGKALALIGGISLLERCLSRLRASGVRRVVLATTEAAEDDALTLVAERMDIDVYRGSTDDVLTRYVGAALAHQFDIVVRATGDNPAVDMEAAGRLLDLMRRTDADYACEDGLPYGAGVEIATTAALTRTASLATDAADREHVTTFVKRHPAMFRVVRELPPAPLRRPDLRLTVDTAADLEFMQRVFARARVAEPSLADLIASADACSRSDAA